MPYLNLVRAVSCEPKEPCINKACRRPLTTWHFSAYVGMAPLVGVARACHIVLLGFSPCGLSRVELPVFLLDELFVDVRIDLRGADVGVAQQFLQYAQVHARF